MWRLIGRLCHLDSVTSCLYVQERLLHFNSSTLATHNDFRLEALLGENSTHDSWLMISTCASIITENNTNWKYNSKLLLQYIAKIDGWWLLGIVLDIRVSHMLEQGLLKVVNTWENSTQNLSLPPLPHPPLKKAILSPCFFCFFFNSKFACFVAG